MVFQADVRDRSAVDNMVAAAEKELGPIDILVNNANINFPMQPFAGMAWPEIEAKLTGEIGAMVHCCQAVIPYMMKKKSGKIVLVSSVLSRQPGQGFAAHCAAKAAVDSLARTMALELGPAGIHVNVVGPGLTKNRRHSRNAGRGIYADSKPHPSPACGKPPGHCQYCNFSGLGYVRPYHRSIHCSRRRRIYDLILRKSGSGHGFSHARLRSNARLIKKGE